MRNILKGIFPFMLGMLVLFVGTASAELVIDSNYQLVSSIRVGRTAYDYTYQVNITNNGTDVQNVTANVSSSSLNTTIINGGVNFGDVAAGNTVAGTDTFTIRQNRSYTFDPNSLTWNIQFELAAQIIPPEGGEIQGEGGIVLIVPGGATSDPIPVTITVLQENDLGAAPPPNSTFLGGVTIDMDLNELMDNADISMPAPDGVPDGAEIYLAKLVEYAGQTMFQLVDTAIVQDGIIVSQDPAFPGVTGSGSYCFLWTQNVGWVEGQVTNINSGIAIPEAVVTLSGGYWLDIADASGYYSLPAWAGNFVVNAFDNQTGDFGEKQGFIPYGGTTVIANVVIGESSGPTQSTLINGGFENGLTGWVLSGAGGVVDSLGPILPYEGSYMAMISSGNGAIGEASSALEQSFTVPEDANKLTIHYNFISEEYPEFVGSEYNDVMRVTLHTPDGSREVAFEDVNSANFQPVSGIPCGSGDCTWGQTGWLEASIDVSQWAGTDDTLTLTVHDVGDTIYDTVVLLDDIVFDYSLVELSGFHDSNNKFVLSKNIVEQSAAYVKAQVRLLSGAGCWYMVTPNFIQNGIAVNYSDVNYLAPYGNILIDDELAFSSGEYLHLDIDRWNVGAYTMTALDVIMRGIFSKKLEDVLTNDKDQISLLIKIIKESGMVSGLDTGTAFLLNGEYLNAIKEYIKGFKQIADLVGHDQMEQIFVAVVGESGKTIWNTGISTLLQMASLPDKYFLLKEISDDYVTNPGPLTGFVRLEAH